MELLLIILPVFLIFAAGYVGQKLIGFDIKTISTMALYLMSPFLAFRTFYANEITMDYFYIILFCFFQMGALFLTVWITSRMMKSTRPQFAAMILGAVFMNSGNYGAPVVLFALGAVGFDYAVIMMVFQTVLMNSFGIFFASLGGSEKATIQDSFQRVIRMPVLYAAIVGVIMQLLHIQIPSSLMEGIHLIADASIPTVMLVLGMQLAVITRKRVVYKFVSATVFIRMIFSPLLAAAVLYFLPVSDLLKTVLIIQSAMPASANTTMFALQFGTESDLVSFCTLVTTLLSLVTVPIVLLLLGVP
ncbi:AEC family transporter [Sporosarcina sp. 179-K 3D1 HS]|uniref:AEC family transporter n=1 Tax=Sporosarcina sp. 179-K 3D1 HS TaxID=3232169 RepID=UPI0039A09940